MTDDKRVRLAFVNYTDKDGGGGLAMRGDTVDMSTLDEKEQKRLESVGAFEGQEPENDQDSLSAYYDQSRATLQRNALEDVPEDPGVDPETALEHEGPPTEEEDEENGSETDEEIYGTVETGAERAAEESGDGEAKSAKRGRRTAKARPAPETSSSTQPQRTSENR